MRATFTLGLLLAAGAVHAASFDCAKAKAPMEKLICGDAEVSKLDEAVALAYRGAQAAKGTTKLLVTRWQRDWLRMARDDCSDAPCLRQAYAAHLAELREHVEAAASAPAIGRFGRIVKGRPDRHEAQLLVVPLKGDRARVVGYASWVGDAASGNVNVGEATAVVAFKGERARFDNGNGCAFDLALADGDLVASGDAGSCGGLNVTFDGRYRKVQ